MVKQDRSQRGLDFLASSCLLHFFSTKYRLSIVLRAGHTAFGVCTRQAWFLLSAVAVKCSRLCDGTVGAKGHAPGRPNLILVGREQSGRVFWRR